MSILNGGDLGADAAVFGLRAGIVTEMRSYLDVADALAAAGLDQ